MFPVRFLRGDTPMHLNKEKKHQLHAELRAVRDHAEGACAQIGDTIAEWRGIRAAWLKTGAISMAIREEAQQVRQQARLSVRGPKGGGRQASSASALLAGACGRLKAMISVDQAMHLSAATQRSPETIS